MHEAVPFNRPIEGEYIGPQPGPQTDFFSIDADIIVYGGSAGGGKTWSLLFEFLRNHYIKGFNALIFRRNATQISTPGGLWDESKIMYHPIGGNPNESSKEWRWPQYKTRIRFTHLQRENDKYSHQGGQYAYVGWDELTHFTKSQFMYLLTRMRSMSGVSPIMRGTCNPDADSWVAGLIEWWIDQESGYPIKERSGVVRWFVVQNDEFVWADTKQELIETYAPVQYHDDPENPLNPIRPKSFAFISAKLTDNKKLMEADPSYQANLLAQNRVERERLMEGNWKIKPMAGMYFRSYFFEVVKAPPAKARRVRFWDQAGTVPSPDNPDPDYTASAKLSKDEDGVYYIEHAERFRREAHSVFKAISNMASSDGKQCAVGLFQDPGQAGKAQAQDQSRKLSGYVVKVIPATNSKEAMAEPVSSQAEAGNIKIVQGPWNGEFLQELENFPLGEHDDYVDALSGAFASLNTSMSGVSGKLNRRI